MRITTISLIDKQRRDIGFIEWRSDGHLSAHLSESHRSLEGELTDLLRQAALEGVVAKAAVTDQIAGTSVVAEHAELVRGADQRFPYALADLINGSRFRDERIFALAPTAPRRNTERED